MPVHCPEVDQTGDGETCSVSLYIVNRQQVWLEADSVDWDVRYMYVQHLLRGVPLVDPNDAGPGTCPSSPATTELDSSSASSAPSQAPDADESQ